MDVLVTNPVLSADQQAELRKVAATVRAISDVMRASARFSRDYLDSFAAGGVTNVPCSDSGHAQVTPFLTVSNDMVLTATFVACVDKTNRLGPGGLQVRLGQDGTGSWATNSLNLGDDEMHGGLLVIQDSQPAALARAPGTGGSTTYGFVYDPTRDRGTPGPHEYCGPSPQTAIDYGCHHLNARLEGVVSSGRTELRLDSATLSIGDFQPNGSFKSMSVTLINPVTYPVLADGLFSTRFANFTSGTLRYQRAKSGAQSFVVDVTPASSTFVRVSIFETNSGIVSTKVMETNWSSFFSSPNYDPY